jgi:hypothetical protein
VDWPGAVRSLRVSALLPVKDPIVVTVELSMVRDAGDEWLWTGAVWVL